MAMLNFAAEAPLGGELLEEEIDESKVYWARKKGRALVDILVAKESAYFDALTRRGLLTMWRIAYAQYYGLDPSQLSDFATQAISTTGPQSEFLRFRINEVRSYIKQMNTIAMGERPAFQCISVNTDYQSMAQVEICDQVINYLYRRSNGEQRERELLEVDGVFGIAFGWDRWDEEAGDTVTTMQPVPGRTLANGQPAAMPVQKKSGAPTTTVLYPWEVVQEPYARNELESWRMVRERRSKWELAAEYPDHAEKILAITALDEYALGELFSFDLEAATTDDCIVKHFYHPRTRAHPEGRYLGFVGDTILWDQESPVSEGTPITELCSGKFFATTFGYADSWDLCSINEMIDQLCSDTASNLATFGRQTLVVDEGTKYDVNLIALGHRVLTKNPAARPPEVVDFAEMPAATKWFLEYLHKRHEAISGLNSVARGDPASNISSGQMAALFHSIAIEYQSGRQAALDFYRERSANLKLDMVRQYADTPFVAEIAGIDERPYMTEFSRESLSNVRRVQVETSNPLMRNIAGRLQVFESIKDLPPEERAAAIELILTGQSKAFTRKDRTCDMRVRWENEQLAQGIPTPVLPYDDPYKHVPKHWAEIEARSAELQNNQAALEAYMAHIAEHEAAYMQMSPIVAQILNIPPPPMPMMGPPMDGGGGELGPVPGGPPPANENGGPAPGRDSSGVKLPKPSEPPPGMAA